MISIPRAANHFLSQAERKLFFSKMVLYLSVLGVERDGGMHASSAVHSALIEVSKKSVSHCIPVSHAPLADESVEELEPQPNKLMEVIKTKAK